MHCFVWGRFRTQADSYLPAFKACVDAGAGGTDVDFGFVALMVVVVVWLGGSQMSTNQRLRNCCSKSTWLPMFMRNRDVVPLSKTLAL